MDKVLGKPFLLGGDMKTPIETVVARNFVVDISRVINARYMVSVPNLKFASPFPR